MQAGSYVDFVENNYSIVKPYYTELASIIRKHICANDSIIDVGTGEMTTLAPIAEQCYYPISVGYALDVSLSRLIVGARYLEKYCGNNSSIVNKIRPIASTLFNLPFASNSIDIVWTSHSVEPNGGREMEAIVELSRICKKWLILFEPSYENNTPEGKARMTKLGYIKGLPDTIASIPQIELVDIIRIDSTTNNLNPTYAYIVRKIPNTDEISPEIRCPVSRGHLQDRGNYLYSPDSLLAYPKIFNIPILRAEKAIIASALS